jgi:hypothetical protein
MWGRLGFWLLIIALAVVWVAAIYFVYWMPAPKAFLPLPSGK